MKRTFDIVVSGSALFVLAPLLLVISAAIWLQDFRSPFYTARRAARGGGTFSMIKFRTMSVGADRSGVNSTASNDRRITPLGRVLRAYKLDELIQLWNVFKGDMSIVGPRPQIPSEVERYTGAERQLMTVQPGITDFSSIVFADEGEILKGAADPDLAYDQLIRPWKSRLGLLYVEHRTLRLDLELIFLTVVALVSRPVGLRGVQRALERLNACDMTRAVARRNAILVPYPTPGATQAVTSRQLETNRT